MTPKPVWSLQTPSPNVELGLQDGSVRQEHQSVMISLAKLTGFFLMTAFAVPLVMVVAYSLAGWTGFAAPIAIIGAVWAIAFRPDYIGAQQLSIIRHPLRRLRSARGGGFRRASKRS